jgi:hypothetical protein
MSPLAGSVVVDDLDFVGMALLPTETDTILLVDPNAVLAPTIAAQSFESVARLDRQMLKISNPVDLIQLPSSNWPQS